MENVKKKWGFIRGYLLCMLLGVCALIFTCCNTPQESSPVPEEEPLEQPASVYEQVEKIVNPEFTSVPEVLAHKQAICDGYKIDSVFTNLNDQILANVANIVLKRNEIATKKTIVAEYLANRAIYDNLPAQPSQQQSEQQQANSPQQQTTLPQTIPRDSIVRIDTVGGRIIKTIVYEQ